jgi:hypothetical protein
MSYLPIQPVNVDLSQIVSLLEDNAECCEINNKYLMSINDRLNRYDFILRELLKCCYIHDTGGNTGVILPTPVLPGQIVSPAPVKPSKPVLPVKPVKEIREVVYESYETPYIPNGSIIDIPGTYTIVGDRYVDKSGTDLRRYLPYELSIKNNDVILEGILDYRVVKNNDIYGTMDVILVYQTKNVKTGVRTTYEAGRNHYRSWWKIHWDGASKSVDGDRWRRGRIG